MKKITPEKYLQMLNDKNIKVLPLENYNGNKNKIKHQCTCGNIWLVAPAQVLMEQKCKQCAINKQKLKITKSEDTYLKELKDNFSEFIPLEKYISYSTKIKHQCSCGNSESITPRTAKSKKKCNICLNKATNHKEYLSILKNKKIEIVPLESFKGLKVKIKHQCICGNIWETRPFQVLNGSKCSCAKVNFCNENFYKNKKTILYYIKIKNSYKVGVCLWRSEPEKDIGNRYRQDKLDIKIISYICYNDGSLAYNREQEIIYKNKNNRAKPILKTGNTELFNNIIFI